MSFINLAIGVFKLWRFMDARQKQFQQRRGVSLKESKALELVLETCSACRKGNFLCQEEILPDTLHLVSRLAAIYHPDEKKPLEKARIGNVLAAFLEMNRQILDMLKLPGLESLTQFRLREVVSGFATNKNNNKNNADPSWVPAFFRIRVMRALQVQWLMLVGEAAIKVYGEHRADEIPEPEVLLDEMDQLQEETEQFLPDEVRDIVETSRKNILFSVKPLPWAEVKLLFISLSKNIAKAWHPESSVPVYEARVYDLLNTLADYLEWAGQLSQKPVLNKMLGLRISHLTGAREIAIPFAGSKLFDWVQKYQVGWAAKWSRTIYKTLQKKQPAILFRDVAISVVKEGGKRWLILYLHDKIAGETNKLYKSLPDANENYPHG